MFNAKNIINIKELLINQENKNTVDNDNLDFNEAYKIMT
jgi:hypothetical protein